ncbi:MAG: lycopene cyclase family protein [Actinomycetota bacterium]
MRHSGRFDADLVIAGAGGAGLSALWQVLHSSAAHRRIIVIDQELEPGDRRTWSFWGDDRTPFAHLSDRRWDRLEVRFPGWRRTDPLGTHAGGRRSYMRVRQRDYDRAVLDLASDRSNVRFLEQSVVGIRDDRDGGVVVLPDGEVRAPVVFQSMRLAPSDREAPVRHPLRQHFAGWEVRTERPIFEPDVVTLMDFDTDQHDGIAFFYVLPEAPDRALVEHTMFSVRPRSASFHGDHVARRLDQMGAGQIDVVRTEHGSIPMEDRPLGQRWGDHVWNLGTVGGMTKPTTGYTFQRIHAQTRHLVAAWAAGGVPAPLPPSPARYRFADRTLLNVLHHRPEHGRAIFDRLFRSSSVDDVLTFLDERSTLAADARMLARLPWPPFLRAAASELGRGATTSITRPVRIAPAS